MVWWGGLTRASSDTTVCSSMPPTECPKILIDDAARFDCVTTNWGIY